MGFVSPTLYQILTDLIKSYEQLSTLLGMEPLADVLMCLVQLGLTPFWPEQSWSGFFFHDPGDVPNFFSLDKPTKILGQLVIEFS